VDESFGIPGGKGSVRDGAERPPDPRERVVSAGSRTYHPRRVAGDRPDAAADSLTFQWSHSMPTEARARRTLARFARLVGVAALAAGTSWAPGAAAGNSDGAAALKVIQIPIRTDGPKSLDPVKGSTQYDNQACCQIFETLLQVKYLVRPEAVEPLLLSEMPKITDNPDGTQTWSCKLRTDVRFQDDECFPGGKGRTMNTRDVFYSWKRLADPEYELENWWIVKDCIVGFDQFQKDQGEAVKAGKKFDYDTPVAGLKEISDHEFEVVLTKPVTKFRWVLTQFQTSIVPREAVEKYGSRFGVHPVGSGPFTCKEGDWRPGENMILNKNPTYHDEFYPTECMPEDKAMGFDKAAGQKLPLVDRVEVTFYVPDPPMWTDFDLGKIGFTQVPAEYFDKAFVKRTRKLREEYAARGIVGHAVPILDFIFRGFNMEDPIVGGTRPRKGRSVRRSASRTTWT
jgi:ABC-type oligopeptide transport system substrate-binding subunit